MGVKARRDSIHAGGVPNLDDATLSIVDFTFLNES